MKTIVITGASSGIGAGISRVLVEQGHRVIGISRSKVKMHELEKEIINETGKFILFDADITSQGFPEAIESFLKRNRIIEVDILINNAGLLINKAFMELTKEDWESIYNVNVFSPALLIKALHSFLKGSKHAHVVNISSIGGLTSVDKFPGLSAYSSSKGALSIMTEVLAKEFIEDSISVNALDLGSVQTEMLEKAFPDYKSPTSVEQMAGFISNFALQGHQVCNGKNIPVSLTSV